MPNPASTPTAPAPSLPAQRRLKNIDSVFAELGKRFSFGGQAGSDQRIYYINTRELTGNKYGTPNRCFRVVDQRAGIDIDIGIRCFGEYSYRVVNPILFYTNVCGNVENAYTRDALDGQLKTELMTALQPAFARISEQGIRYSALPGHTAELAEALNQELSAKWSRLRGIEIVSLGVSGVKASEEDEQMIKELQRSCGLSWTPPAAAAHLVGAQASAMQAAASNTAAGPAMAFMGMNQAAAAGGCTARESLPDGRPAARRAASGRTGCWLDLQLRPHRQHWQVLCRMRQAPARSPGCLGVQLRCKEQRQILLGMRQAPARRQVRQLRLCARRPGQPAQVLPRVRQALWGLRGV